MVQLDVIRYYDKTCCVNNIKIDGNVVAVFDEEKNKIDFSCLVGYEGQPLKILYFDEEKDGQLVLSEEVDSVLKKIIEQDGIKTLVFD